MAVITRYIVVRDGVELDQVFDDKKAAEAYDAMLDASQRLTLLITQGGLPVEVDRSTIDAISIWLAQNASEVIKILKNIKPLKTSSHKTEKEKPGPGDPADDRKSETRTRAKTRSS